MVHGSFGPSSVCAPCVAKTCAVALRPVFARVLYPDLSLLVFWDFLVFFSVALWDFLGLLSIYPFSQGFEGFGGERKNPCFLGGFLAFLGKDKKIREIPFFSGRGYAANASSESRS